MLKRVFKSEKGTFFFPGSGTGAWESAIINTMSPDEKVLNIDTDNLAIYGQICSKDLV